MSAAPRVSGCEHTSLPTTFFDDARRASVDADRLAHSHRCLLARGLLLASQHRWVADWLFSDPHCSFHGNLPVPLSAFDCAHPMSIMHLFQREGFTRRLASNMLVIPIATMNSICVGYTVSQGSKWQRSVGRYAFNSRSREMLLVVNYFSPTITAVMSVIPQALTVKQFLFTCPSGEYSFDNLPNQVFTAHLGEREPTATTAAPQPAHQSQTLPSSIDYFLELSAPTDSTQPSSEESTFLPLVDFEAPSHLPWIIDDSSSLSDNIGIPATPGTADTSSGAFNVSALSEAIRQIGQTLQGKFEGRAENHYPLAMTLESPVEHTVVNINTADGVEATLLRRYAVNVYFEATMPVVSDERFLTLAPATAPSRPLLQHSQNARRIAPSPGSVSSDRASATRTEAEVARERMLEARRRRNRLSAARSNEKRKEAWKRSVQTLQELKQRVQQLEGKQRRLVEENGALRKQVARGADRQ